MPLTFSSFEAAARNAGPLAPAIVVQMEYRSVMVTA